MQRREYKVVYFKRYLGLYKHRKETKLMAYEEAIAYQNNLRERGTPSLVVRAKREPI